MSPTKTTTNKLFPTLLEAVIAISACARWEATDGDLIAGVDPDAVHKVLRPIYARLATQEQQLRELLYALPRCTHVGGCERVATRSHPTEVIYDSYRVRRCDLHPSAQENSYGELAYDLPWAGIARRLKV